MDPYPDPAPSAPRELRILVLHNRDFDAASAPRDADDVSRADVVTAAQDIARALAARGHFVEVQSIDTEDLGDLFGQLKADRPDLVFNLCESLGGDSRFEMVLPGLLELLHVPYTGSGPLSLGLCQHKFQTKQVLRAAGIPTPAAALLPAIARERSADLAAVAAIGYPLFVKLATDDGSLGISADSVVASDEALLRQIGYMRERYRRPLLVERYIPGRELYAALLGNDPVQVLPLLEIDFSKLPSDVPKILSYEAKWNVSSHEYKITESGRAAPMAPAVLARVDQVARQSFAALDVWDYARCDMRLADDGTPYVLEVNPNCDLADRAGFAKSAAMAGLAYDQLVERVALAALARHAKEPA